MPFCSAGRKSVFLFLLGSVFLVVFRRVLRDVVKEFLGEVQRKDGVVSLRFVLERGERIRAAALLDEKLGVRLLMPRLLVCLLSPTILPLTF